MINQPWLYAQIADRREARRELLVIQDGRCAGCFEQPITPTPDLLHVDHDHVTGLVRGLLCPVCNQGEARAVSDWGVYIERPPALMASSECAASFRQRAEVQVRNAQAVVDEMWATSIDNYVTVTLREMEREVGYEFRQTDEHQTQVVETARRMAEACRVDLVYEPVDGLPGMRAESFVPKLRRSLEDQIEHVLYTMRFRQYAAPIKAAGEIDALLAVNVPPPHDWVYEYGPDEECPKGAIPRVRTVRVPARLGCPSI
jgi:hypothetical protein